MIVANLQSPDIIFYRRMKDILKPDKTSIQDIPHGHNFPSVLEIEDFAQEVKASTDQYQDDEVCKGKKLDWNMAKDDWLSLQSESSRHTAELEEVLEPYMLLDE
jgi:hypothetical protein